MDKTTQYSFVQTTGIYISSCNNVQLLTHLIKILHQTNKNIALVKMYSVIPLPGVTCARLILVWQYIHIILEVIETSVLPG